MILEILHVHLVRWCWPVGKFESLKGTPRPIRLIALIYLSSWVDEGTIATQRFNLHLASYSLPAINWHTLCQWLCVNNHSTPVGTVDWSRRLTELKVWNPLNLIKSVRDEALRKRHKCHYKQSQRVLIKISAQSTDQEFRDDNNANASDHRWWISQLNRAVYSTDCRPYRNLTFRSHHVKNQGTRYIQVEIHRPLLSLW